MSLSTTPPLRPLVLGQIDLSFHVASSAVVQQLLIQAGVRYELRQAPHEQLYEWLGKGEIDMAVSAWLPGSHGRYIDPINDQLHHLGVLYEPYTLWGVPDYIPQEVLGSVADLRKPEVLARMRKRIQGIGPGAGISRFSREIIADYELDPLGYSFHNGSLDDCVGAFESALLKREWVVIPLWHPQFLHSRYTIRALDEPRGLLRGKDQATLVLRHDAKPLLPAALLQQLQAIHLGNAVVAELDYAISREQLTPLDAAKRWMSAHQDIVRTWQ